MNGVDVALWGVLPYIAIVLLVGGTIWRYRYDRFGWTTRSSQLYESRLLRIGSPLFHFGLIFVIVGHIGGLVVPESWTEAAGVSEGLYHFNALLFGGLAGFCTLVGVAILVYRRRTTGPGVHGDDAQRQDDVRRPCRGDRPRALDDAAQRRRRLRGAQLPGDGRAVVPVAVRPSARRGRDGGSSLLVPAAHPRRTRALRHVAVHPTRARVHCTRALPVPSVRRLPHPRRPAQPRRDEPTVVAGNRSGREIARNHDHHETRDDRRHAQPRAGHVGIRRRLLGLEHHRSTRGVVPRRSRSGFDAELDPGGDAGTRRFSRSYTGRGSHRPRRRQADVRSPVVPVDYPGAARHARGERELVRRAARRRISSSASPERRSPRASRS